MSRVDAVEGSGRARGSDAVAAWTMRGGTRQRAATGAGAEGCGSYLTFAADASGPNGLAVEGVDQNEGVV